MADTPSSDLPAPEPSTDKAFAELLQQYKALNEAGKTGHEVHAQDFDRAEQVYNQNPDVQKQYAEHIEKSPIVRAYEQEHPDAKLDPRDYLQVGQAFLAQDHINGANRDKILADLKENQALLNESVAKQADFFSAHPDLLAAISDTDGLAQAFKKEHLTGQPPKRLDVSPMALTQEDMLRELLQQNPGVAIADLHIKAAAADFVTGHMALLKKLGVDTIYTEVPLADSKAIMAMDPKQLGEFADQMEHSLSCKLHEAVTYSQPSDKIDNFWVTNLRMLAAAKEQGIRVIYADEPDSPARDAELPFLAMEHRVAQDNFVWTEHIQADRQQLEKTTGHKGKFLVFGGKKHFTAYDLPSSVAGNLKLPAHKDNGLVDEALGIPVIGFEKSDPKTAPAFRKSGATNDVDFYLPGGMDYEPYKAPPATKPAATNPKEEVTAALLQVGLPNQPFTKQAGKTSGK